MPIETPIGNLDIKNATLRTSNLETQNIKIGSIFVNSYPGLETTANVGNTTSNTIQFTNTHTAFTTTGNVSVGGELTVTGDMTAGYLYGDASNVTGITSNLHQIAEIGNVTSNTLQFTNATTGFVTTGNVSVGGELTVTGNVAVDTDTLFVDTVNNRVGVGTTTPQKTLEVAGPMRITDGLSNVCDLSVVVETGDFDTGTEITPPDGYTSSYGMSSAVSGDGTRVIVGSPSNTNGGSQGPNAGAVYIYTYSGGSWDAGTKIQPSDISGGPPESPHSGDYFGNSVAMNSDGTKFIVGANRARRDLVGTDATGVAYIFTYNGTSWIQEGRLSNSALLSQDFFGESVAMNSDGTRVIVGAPQARWATNNTNMVGGAYIYTYDGSSWGSEVHLQAGNKGTNDYYGFSVAMSGDGTKIVVGAYKEDYHTDSGAVYIYTYNGSSWNSQGPSGGMIREGGTGGFSGSSGDKFGYSVAMSGDGMKFIVGVPEGQAFNHTTNNTQTVGSAYIFTYSSGSWGSGVKIQASDAANGDQFGHSVAMNSDGTRVIVGAKQDDPFSVGNAGSAYIYKYLNGSWSQHRYLTANIDATGPATYKFGTGVGMSSNGAKVVVSQEHSRAIIFDAPRLPNLIVSGPISAAGSQLSFTGQHICVPEGPMYRGLVVSANKNRYVSLNGTLTTGVGAIRSSESLPVVSLSNVASDQSVFGVVDRLEQGRTTERRQVLGATVVTAQKELGDTRVIVNSLGEGAIWVADTNGPLVSGDYMTTSNITGYTQKQDDDILHNYTVAKITMDCDFEPDDVPVQVIKKTDTGDNDLDVYGRIQWEDHPSNLTQKAYTIGYLTADGTPTDEANVVHRTAYVGCTYHCG